MEIWASLRQMKEVESLDENIMGIMGFWGGSETIEDMKAL